MNAGTLMLKDPFSDETRRRRRGLLVSSIIAILISAAGWLPTEISALGIKFGPLDQQMTIWLTFAVVLYFLFTFAMATWAELIQAEHEIEHSFKSDNKEHGVPWQIAAGAYYSRYVLDWIFPTVLAALALVSLTWCAIIGTSSSFLNVIVWIVRVGSTLLLLLTLFTIGAMFEELFAFIFRFRRHRIEARKRPAAPKASITETNSPAP